MYIRLAKIKEKELIKDFINRNWKKDHILTNSNELLDYMYKGNQSINYNFIISSEEINSPINGILGFIPTQIYDKQIESNKNIIWYSIWKVLELPGCKLLGIRLIRYLSNLYPESNLGTVGANINTLNIYKALGYSIGKLNNFVAFNPLIENYKICKLIDNNLITSENSISSNSSIINISNKINSYISTINLLAIESDSIKSFAYIEQRYIKHPMLKYEFWLLKVKSDYSLIVLRRIKYKKSSLIKIVDFIGKSSLLVQLKSDLRQMILRGSEYIEFRCYGLDKELTEAGFLDVKENDNIIIPAYHQPFVFKNKTIYWSIKNKPDNFHIVTGDCDQDRPN